MTDLILKIKANEVALTTNNTVANSITTISSSKLVRLVNSNTTTVMVVTLLSANAANLNQTTQYANLTMAPSATLIVRKNSTDFINGNAAILATPIALG